MSEMILNIAGLVKAELFLSTSFCSDVIDWLRKVKKTATSAQPQVPPLLSFGPYGLHRLSAMDRSGFGCAGKFTVR